MKKTKAAFRAIREECGLTQQDIADEADVKILSVKRWENTKEDHQPPDDVWQWLLALRGAMYEDARHITTQIIESLTEDAKDLVLDYYRTQEDLDSVQLPEADEPVGYVNARTRLVGQMLDAKEIKYSYAYRGAKE